MASAGCRNLSAPFRAHLAGVGSPDACDAVEQLLLALPFQSGDAERFPAIDPERDVVKRASTAQAVHFEGRGLAPSRGTGGASDGRRRRPGDVRAQHQLDDRLFPALGRRHADRDPVARHRRPVAEQGDFGHAMRNEDDARAACAKIAHDLEHALREIQASEESAPALSSIRSSSRMAMR
jgi:hypothetical protein